MIHRPDGRCRDHRTDITASSITDQLGQLCASDGMRFGPDGKLYGTRWFAGTVARIDVDSGDFQDVVIGFGAPASLKFDRNDNLYVADALGGATRSIPRPGRRRSR
jgi:hypothetical protein